MSSCPSRNAALSAPTDPAAFRLATFLVTAARDVIDEPAIYAPFRMIDAVDRLMAGSFDDAFLAEIQPEQNTFRLRHVADEPAERQRQFFDQGRRGIL